MLRAWAQIAAGASAALVLALLAHAAIPHPRPPVPLGAPMVESASTSAIGASAKERIVEGPPGPSAKSDRLPLAIAFGNRVAFPDPPPPAALPIRSALPVRSIVMATDICTRHRGWKVVTDNGRSWHCAYARETSLR
jgi:hypothetical protein